MNKISNSKIYIIVLSVLLCIAIALIIRFLFDKREINSFVSSHEVYQGESIFYSDSTFRAEDWLWEFGNGDVSVSKSGKYTYPETGVYQLRLTVDKSMHKEYIINVRNRVSLEVDSLIQIDAPSTAVQDEFIIFKGVGIAKDWRWSFGRTGAIDARDQVAMYSFDLPGHYVVELMTENTNYPIKHAIEILPKYSDNESDDPIVQMGNDIRERLQAIVDGAPFNVHYNYILRSYLCNNPNILVTVNNDKKNDFYSYCQGLKIIGRNNTDIQEVIVVLNDSRPGCLSKLFVIQSTRKE